MTDISYSPISLIPIISLLQDGLVNFNKCRKEFEILAQLTLFQKAATNYSFQHRPLLVQWLRETPVHSEDER